MENGSPSIEEAGLVKADGLALLPHEQEKNAVECVDGESSENASEIFTTKGNNRHSPEQVTACNQQDISMTPSTGRPLLEVGDEIHEQEVDKEHKRMFVGGRKASNLTNQGKMDSKAVQAPLKKKSERMVHSGVFSGNKQMETTPGGLKVRIPHANTKMTAGSTPKSTHDDKGPGTPKDSNPPNSARQLRGVRSSHSHFTVPQPFALATDRRASMEGRSMEFHPLGRSQSFQAARKGERNTADYKGESMNCEKSKATQLRASTNSFSFNSDSRAERRKEFNSRLEERLTAKEVASKQAQAKTKEEVASEIKEFRKSLSFKATPMPCFYQDSISQKLAIKKIPPTRPKSPRLGRKRNTAGDSRSGGASTSSFLETPQDNIGDGHTHVKSSFPKRQERMKSEAPDVNTTDSEVVPEQCLREEPPQAIEESCIVSEEVPLAPEQQKPAEPSPFEEHKHGKQADVLVTSEKKVDCEDAHETQVEGEDAAATFPEEPADTRTAPPLPSVHIDKSVKEQHLEVPPAGSYKDAPRKREIKGVVNSGIATIKSKLGRIPSSKTIAAQQEAKEHGTKTIKKKPVNASAATPRNLQAKPVH